MPITRTPPEPSARAIKQQTFVLPISRAVIRPFLPRRKFTSDTDAKMSWVAIVPSDVGQSSSLGSALSVSCGTRTGLYASRNVFGSPTSLSSAGSKLCNISSIASRTISLVVTPCRRAIVSNALRTFSLNRMSRNLAVNRLFGPGFPLPTMPLNIAVHFILDNLYR